MKSLFVSSVFEDNSCISKLNEWAENSQLEGVVITHETEDKRHEGQQAIDNHIRKKIEGSAAVLVAVGDDTHNHDWIRREVELANNFNKQVIVTRLPGTTGAKPEILKKYEEVEFTPDAIQKKLNE